MADEHIKLPDDLRERMIAVKRVYESPDWEHLAKIFRVHLEALRTQNERVMPENERNWLLGQIFTLRYVLELPEKVSEEARRFKEETKLMSRPNPDIG